MNDCEAKGSGPDGLEDVAAEIDDVVNRGAAVPIGVEGHQARGADGPVGGRQAAAQKFLSDSQCQNNNKNSKYSKYSRDSKYY